MRKTAMLVPVMAVAVAVTACGPDNGPGFYATGDFQATVTDTSASTAPTHTGFRFPNATRIDTTLPAGAATGITGSCQVGPTGRTLHLTQAGAEPGGLRALDMQLPPWDQAPTPNALSQLALTIGTATFVGTEGAANSTCVFGTTRRGSFGMDVTITCQNITAPGDSHSINVTSTLALDECDGPETRSP